MGKYLTIHVYDVAMTQGKITGDNPADTPEGEPIFITVRDKYGEIVCVIETRDDEPRAWGVALNTTGIGMGPNGIEAPDHLAIGPNGFATIRPDVEGLAATQRNRSRA